MRQLVAYTSAVVGALALMAGPRRHRRRLGGEAVTFPAGATTLWVATRKAGVRSQFSSLLVFAVAVG